VSPRRRPAGNRAGGGGGAGTIVQSLYGAGEDVGCYVRPVRAGNGRVYPMREAI